MKKVLLIILLMSPFFVFAKEEVKYSKCIDGDTIKVTRNKEEITVRLLAVDTPEYSKEKEYYGKESSEYTCNMLKNAKKIELEYDSKSDENDKYGRVLAWVYVDDYLLEDLLVRNGYAEVAYIYADYKYVDILKEHETLARLQKVGIWDEDTKESYNNSKEISTKDESKEEVNIFIVIFLSIIGIIYSIVKKKLKKKLKKSKITLS